MNWQGPDVYENFKLFKQKMNIFFTLEKITDNAIKANHILAGIQDEGLRRFNSWGLTAEEQKNPETLYDKFDASLRSDINFRVNRLTLLHYRQRPDENIDDFVVRCKTLAQQCEFGDNELSEQIIGLVIASTKYDFFRNDLLVKEKGYPLSEMIKLGRQYEAKEAGTQKLQALQFPTQTQTPSPETNIHAMKKPPPQRDCGNCGQSHARRACPAYNSVCRGCGNKGHWVEHCRITKQRRSLTTSQQFDRHDTKPPRRPQQQNYTGQNQPRASNSAGNYIHSSELQGDQDHCTFDSIEISGLTDTSDKQKRSVFTHLSIKGCHLKGQHKLHVKLDNGAEANTIPVRIYNKMKPYLTPDALKPTNQILTAYNGGAIDCIGKIDLDVKHCRRDDYLTTSFFIVDVDAPAILGLPDVQSLGYITIHCSLSTGAPQLPSPVTLPVLKDLFPDCFDKIGSFPGEAHLHVKDGAIPHVDPPRRHSVNLIPRIQDELDKMERQGVIRKVDYHTDWCSSLAVSIKKNGDLRLCLDPKKLNSSLKRCPHKIPNLEEIQHKLANAKHFSKLDAKAGYWAVHLDTPSQNLTTFRSPHGRYCFTRLPFGIAVSQDIFQQRMDEILEKCKGTMNIMDDIVVFGKTQREHDENLITLFNTARKNGLVFNSNKCDLNKQSVSFFGVMFTDHGIKPDPAKIQALRELPTPHNVEDLRKFLGLLTYLSPFIPKLADKAAPLRALTHQSVQFIWEPVHQETFDNLKKIITEEDTLSYYQPELPVELHVDASMKGLGAALVQNGRPIAFASKTLDRTQASYANIEREMLAVVFGISRFHHYLYGRRFIVVSDHSPLEMIWKKPIARAPPRLQRMLLKVQGYDFDIQHRPGSEMILADTLSRLPGVDASVVDLDLRVDGISIADDIDATAVDMIHFSPQKASELRTHTLADPDLYTLQNIIITGWPNRQNDLPRNVRQYWSYRDELGVEDGILYKGSQVLVPVAMRDEILRRLHQAHQGIEKTRLLAKERVFWPGYTSDIEKMVRSCSTCQKYLPNQQAEPLMQHELPRGPWVKLGMDMFSIGDDEYLLIGDYFSKYPIVKKIAKPVTSQAVVKVTKETFGLFGIPECVMSDNGPHFVGYPFKELMTQFGIQHDTSSPRYAQSNGFIENVVGTVKKVLLKCYETRQDVDFALLNLRTTPIGPSQPSPAEILFGRLLNNTIPSHFQPRNQDNVKMYLDLKRTQQKRYYDAHARNSSFPALHPGQQVTLQDNRGMWRPATVESQFAERSYNLSTPQGSFLRRNRRAIRDSQIEVEKEGRGTIQNTTLQPESESEAVATQKPSAQDTVPTGNFASTATPSRTGRGTVTTRAGRDVKPPSYLKDYLVR